MTIAGAHLRVARPTDNIEALLPVYRDGLGFELIFKFEDYNGDHNGLSGVFLGHKGAGYHLEFTSDKNHLAGRAPTQDNLLVFYITEQSQYAEALDRMKRSSAKMVASFSPYWDQHGKTFEDADGYRVVLVNESSPV